MYKFNQLWKQHELGLVDFLIAYPSFDIFYVIFTGHYDVIAF